MKKILSIIAITSVYVATANAYPTLDQLPKIEPGKAALLIYSSSLRATASYDYYIDSKKSWRN